MRAGITAAAGTRLALQLVIAYGFRLISLQSRSGEPLRLLFLVTTSPNWDWVIYAPAAFLRSNGRLSGLFSGIKP